MKIKYRPVFNRKNQLDAQGNALVQIECYLRPRKAYFSTDIKVSPEQWRGLVVSHKNASELNAYIIECITKLEAIEMDLWKHGVTPTLDHLRRAWKSGMKLTDFGAFARSVITHSDRKPRTIDNLMHTIRSVDSFRKVDISDIDYAYLKEFEQWLRERGIHDNTISKQMTNIQTIISEAMRFGLVKENPFLVYQKPKIVQRSHVTLTEREMRRVASVQVHTAVRDAFLFCCHTGLRFGDYKRLDEAQWVNNGKKRWLVIDTQKTGAIVRLPIHLIGDYPHPHIGSNSDVNRQLRDIIQHARINKHVTFHTARHTFATVLLNKGVDLVSVQKLLGHTSVRMTQRYAETKDRKVEQDLRKAMKVEI